jgi:predicted MFS family arabinose efflux permease
VTPFWLVLGPTIMDQQGHGPERWGTVLAAAGIGAIIGSAIALRTRRPLGLRAVTVLCATQAVELVSLAVDAPLVVISAAAFVGAAAFSISSALWNTIFQASVAPEMISRLSSYSLLAYSVPTAIGFALAAPAAQVVGTTAALMTAVVITAATALWALSVMPSHTPAPVASEA